MKIELKRLDGYLQNATLILLLAYFVPKLFIKYHSLESELFFIVLMLLLLARGVVHYKLRRNYSGFFPFIIGLVLVSLTIIYTYIKN